MLTNIAKLPDKTRSKRRVGCKDTHNKLAAEREVMRKEFRMVSGNRGRNSLT